MFARNRIGSGVIAALVIGAGTLSAWAGPQDIRTNYPVGIGVGGQEFPGIVDSGGVTTLSYEDAKKAGLLDANGDPVNPPDGTTSLGGTGGGSVKCHRFDKVNVKVQPKNADGTNNGPAKEIEVTVVVPKKPSEQDGADDAAKQKKTDSVITKAGRNIAGATIDGSKLELTDKSTSDPNKNARSTGWTAAAIQDRFEVPFNEDEVQDDNTFFPCSTPTVILNGVPMPSAISAAPMSVIPQSLAMELGGVLVGQMPLDFAGQSLLFVEGFWPHLPQPNPIPVQVVAINVVLPTLNGPPIQNSAPALFITTPFIQQTLVGGNALIPEGWSATFNSDLNLIQFAQTPTSCAADFDGSGFVDTDDFDAFVRAFQDGDIIADFDGSGFVDTDDFDAFVRAFEAGC
jgi:hypothetical protein